MAASDSLPQKSYRFQNGVRIVSGYGASIRVNRGHLVISDRGIAGTGESRLERVAHDVKRVVCISPDFSVTGSALAWMCAQDISFLVIERDGTVQLATGQQGKSDARLRRVQACLPEAVALRIAKELVNAKLEGQERNLRGLLSNNAAAETIALHRLRLYRRADSIRAVRNVESLAAQVYWKAWSDLPVTFQQSDVSKVPSHWLTWGSRYSPLSGHSPRLAVTPAQACLNYLLAILESESRIACVKMGMDVGLGVLHSGYAYRPSLALDLMEPCRSNVDRWLFEFLREPLDRRMCFERSDGNCRMMAKMCSRLSETASRWAREVAPWAEWFARQCWEACTTKPARKPPTRLTGSARRDAKQAG